MELDDAARISLSHSSLASTLDLAPAKVLFSKIDRARPEAHGCTSLVGGGGDLFFPLLLAWNFRPFFSGFQSGRRITRPLCPIWRTRARFASDLSALIISQSRNRCLLPHFVPHRRLDRHFFFVLSAKENFPTCCSGVANLSVTDWQQQMALETKRSGVRVSLIVRGSAAAKHPCLPSDRTDVPRQLSLSKLQKIAPSPPPPLQSAVPCSGQGSRLRHRLLLGLLLLPLLLSLQTTASLCVHAVMDLQALSCPCVWL